MGKEIRKEIEESSEGAAVKAASFRRPARIAHRGDIWSGPENTMSAFWGAVRKGCEGIEMDIRRTADGKIVVAHDAGFGRVMCGCTEPEKRSIREMTLIDIRIVPLPFAGHLLDCFPDEGLQMNCTVIFHGIWTTGRPSERGRCSFCPHLKDCRQKSDLRGCFPGSMKITAISTGS